MLTISQLQALKADMIARGKDGLSDDAVESFYNTPLAAEGTTTFKVKKESGFKLLVGSGDYFTIEAQQSTNPIAKLFIFTLSSPLYSLIDFGDPDSTTQMDALVANGTGPLKQSTRDDIVALSTRYLTPAEKLFGWGETKELQTISHLDVAKARSA